LVGFQKKKIQKKRRKDRGDYRTGRKSIIVFEWSDRLEQSGRMESAREKTGQKKQHSKSRSEAGSGKETLQTINVGEYAENGTATVGAKGGSGPFPKQKASKKKRGKFKKGKWGGLGKNKRGKEENPASWGPKRRTRMNLTKSTDLRQKQLLGWKEKRAQKKAQEKTPKDRRMCATDING